MPDLITNTNYCQKIIANTNSLLYLATETLC
jgi:hypothetical protein